MLNVRLNVRLTKNPSTRLAGQLAGLRPLLQAVQNEFHTRRKPELVEYLEQVIAGGNRFLSVRFGNVAGGAGSTRSVPRLFWEQIQKGNPIRVTDPRAARYFMSVPEAVHLILRAAALG